MMRKITATFNVFEDDLMAESECASFEDAVRQELGWLHDSGMECESWEEILPLDEEPDSTSHNLEQYQAVYGDIIFPDQSGEGQSKVRRDIYANPAGWMYSYDGLTWKPVPMDIGKIDYPKAMFRKMPSGISLGTTDDILKNPQMYCYSTDNGNTWKPLREDDNPSSHVWIYHANHDWIWFKRYPKERGGCNG